MKEYTLAYMKEMHKIAVSKRGMAQEIIVIINSEFMRFKKVNKRFSDRLEKLGYHCYWNTERVVFTRFPANYDERIEIYMGGDELDWGFLLSELTLPHFERNIKYWKDKIASFDKDLQDLKQLYEIIKSYEGCNLFNIRALLYQFNQVFQDNP